MRSIGSFGHMLILGLSGMTLATSGEARAQSHDAASLAAGPLAHGATPSRDSAITTLLTGPLGSRSLSGTATLSGTTMRVTVSGDRPGVRRPWHVHRGTCSRDEGIVGVADAYQPLVVDSHGEGSATATLAAPLTPGVGHVVQVHDTTPGAALAVIACGTLTRPAAGTDTATMDMSTMPPMAQGTIGPDSVASLLTAVYDRMTADPVIRERAATDPVLRRLMTQLATARGAATGHAPTAGGAMPGMAMPPVGKADGASPAKGVRTSPRPRNAKPARKPAIRAAPQAAPRPPKDSMPPGMKMPGMDHGTMGSMPGMGKP